MADRPCARAWNLRSSRRGEAHVRSTPCGCCWYFSSCGGARASLIHEYGSPLPFWDEWDAEGGALYPAYQAGELEFSSLVAPHNEHRIFFTRVQSLAMFAWLQAWEPRIAMALNAVWMASAAAWLAHVVMIRIGGLPGIGLAGLCAVLFAAPHSWQNTLWGFQSHGAFALLTGVALLALVSSAQRSWTTWCGMVGFGVAGLLTTGAGVLAPLAAAIVMACYGLSRTRSRRDGAIVCLGGVLAAAGWFLAVEVPGHAALRAQSLETFLAVFLHGIAWPGLELTFLVPLLWAPLCLLAARLLRGRISRSAASDLALLLGVWAVVHAESVAWARGSGLPGHLPLSRYLDGLTCGVLANGIALVLCCRTPRGGRRIQIVTASWLAAVAMGLAHQTYTNFGTQLKVYALSARSQSALIEAYVQAGDPAVFANRNVLEIGHHDPESIRRVLDEPANAPWLPTAARRPLEVSLTGNAPTSFDVPVTGDWEIAFPFLALPGSDPLTFEVVPTGAIAGSHVTPVQLHWGRRAWVSLRKGMHQIRAVSGLGSTETVSLAFRATPVPRRIVERLLASGLWIALVTVVVAGAWGLGWRLRRSGFVKRGENTPALPRETLQL